jgi:putative nucleotidyltransferase with HDIG domain
MLRFSGAAKIAEVKRFLGLKTVEAQGMQSGESARWDQLLRAAAGASGVEDPTGEHGLRVARLARRVAESLGVDGLLLEGVEAGALVHEIGKAGVADVILRKTDLLDDDERVHYDSHAEAGAALLERADFPHKRTAIDIARHHHTPFDGHGDVERAVRSEAIPLAARIVAVCDAFDALVMGRPRRGAMSVKDAQRELLRGSGRDFDPRVVSAAIEVLRHLEALHGDVMAHLAEGADEIEFFATQRMLRRLAGAPGRQAGWP